jgi:hypothetical protein
VRTDLLASTHEQRRNEQLDLSGPLSIITRVETLRARSVMTRRSLLLLKAASICIIATTVVASDSCVKTAGKFLKHKQNQAAKAHQLPSKAPEKPSP